MSFLATILLSLSLTFPQQVDTLDLQQIDTIRLESRTYIGQSPYGNGKLYDKERGLLIGTFDKAVLTGFGVHFKPDGGKYIGEFKNGKYDGQGQLFQHTGTVICGEFHGGRANGLDTLYYPDGKVFIGIMQNNSTTSSGKTYNSVKAAKAVKPTFPEVKLREEDYAFLDNLRNDEYDTPAVFKDGSSFTKSYIHPNFKVTGAMKKKSAVIHYEYTIGADGKIRDVNILSTTNDEYADELVRVLKKSPRWTPATKFGHPVPYTFRNQRISFN